MSVIPEKKTIKIEQFDWLKNLTPKEYNTPYFCKQTLTYKYCFAVIRVFHLVHLFKRIG